MPTTTADPVGLLQCVGLGFAAYIASIGAWRWLTYEARTLETYVPLAGLAAIPLIPLVPLALCPAGATGHPLFALLALGVLAWDALAVYYAWRHFVAGPRFKRVDMRGKVCVVTGANTGIGRETARFLAEMGAQVVMACRSKGRAEDAIKEILKTSPGIKPSQLEFMPLDVSSLASVRAFAAEYRAAYDGLDVLVNNAGVMLNDRALTGDGLEATMATNHHGHFLLTLLLFPELEKAEDGRIVNVSSSLHKVPTAFNFDDPSYDKGGYTLFGAYAQSKLANVLFTAELQRRIQGLQQGKRRINLRSASRRALTANAVHPGNVQTEVTRNMPPLLYWGQRLCSPLFLLYQKTPPLGAYTTVHVATAPELRCVGGQYFVNSRATEDVNPLARDPAVGERLWAESERACGLLVDGDGEGGVGNGNGNGSGNGGSGTPARRRRRKDSVDGSGSGGKKGGGGSGASTPQRRRSGLRRSGSKGKLMS